MSRRRVREDWWDDADIDRAQIFVPAIMGAGILISAFTLLRDAMHDRRRRGRDRRSALHARGVAAFVRTGADPDTALVAGLRPRVHYLLLAVSAGALAGYGAWGATTNYDSPPPTFGGGSASVYALLLVAVAGLAAVALTSGISFATWPAVPRWQRPLLAGTPLGQRPPETGDDRGSGVLLLGWAAVLTAAAAAQFLFTTAGAPQVLAELDDEVAATAQASVAPWELLGHVPVGVGVAVVVGLLTRRCPPFALGQLTVVLAAYGLHAVFADAVERVHPPDGPLAGMTGSLPSSPVLQATLLVGFVPLAVYVRTRRRRPAVLALALTGPVLLAFAVVVVRDRSFWPSDAVAGVLVGTALVLATWWMLEPRHRHARCENCPWSPSGAAAHPHGVLRIGPSAAADIRRTSRRWLAAMIVLLTTLALVEGLPTSPDGQTMGPGLARPIQLGLLVLAVVALFVSIRWLAAGAALAAVAGTALAVFAAITYQPWVSLLIAGAFLAPAVGLWLAWQHRRTLRSVTTLALVTALLLAGTYGAAAAVYDSLYGPAHPQSGTLELPLDSVVWSWSGGVTSRSAVVVAALAEPTGTARLVVEPASGPAVRSGKSAASPAGVVRLSVDGLEPGTEYRYAVEVDGVADTQRGSGRFRTFPEGPASFTLAVGACARTGSNGSVFDAIRAVDPLFYVAAGDLHYANITGDDATRFGDRYRDVLTAPAQAALYRSVPTSYVWGDHDFGGDDADSSSLSAPAAMAAYRAYVPHHDLAGGDDGAVYQAFTVGRVRVVLTDTRSQRTADSMLGERQLRWLEEELVTGARDHALVVWVNPDPWVAPAEPGRDDWGGYADERRRIADVIAGAGIDNLVMLSGDAHMVAIDDGTNTDYSSSGEAGFPLLHAAALDRPGSVKGGPYSEGTFPGPGQFGTVEVADTGGDTVAVGLAGHDWRGDVLVSLDVTVPVGDEA